ncbi:MAG: zinc metalloprotease HtpX [Bacteroidia bacterium]|nr:zinc metalloprotease HtpX [Bacteroidia bacterium]
MTWNSVKTFLLLASLTVLLVFIGHLAGGPVGMTIALIIAAIMNLVAYFFGHKLILWQYRAQPLPEREYKWLYDMTRRLTQRAGMPMPKLYLIPELQPNAFATGPSPAQGIVAFTAGLLQNMTQDEIEGVLAHELAHIKNRDMLTMTIAATVVGAITWLVDMMRWSIFFRSSRDREEDNGLGLVLAIVIGIVAALAATLIQLAISRAREYEADRTAALMVGRPDGLISALAKLQQLTQMVPMQHANTATAHLFIANPFGKAGDIIVNLFSTHPPIPKRIAKLQALKQTMSAYRLA